MFALRQATATAAARTRLVGSISIPSCNESHHVEKLVTYPSRKGKEFSSAPTMHGTTILCVRKGNQICMIGDGQVSKGSVVVKPNARKVRRIFPKGSSSESSTGGSSSESKEVKEDGTIVGFAGSTADAFTLLERLESKLEEYPGQLPRSCVELAKGWRTDKYLRRLEASLLVADSKHSFELTGNGDVLESHNGILGVGSGSFYAIAAARALIDVDGLDAEMIARKSMEIASDMCVYTNKEFISETIVTDVDNDENEGAESKDEKKE
mmetsp:Transcript_37009/g.44592  ORF Transcript_37009/g.44592 Transcript_37009/m.44592 type:complete len:267 (-) Transcript_37009:453-1253(-)